MNPRQSLLPEALRIPAPPYVNPFFWWAIGLGVLCLLGRVEIKLIEDIPITLQTLLVVVLPALLGTRIGTLAVLGYLVAGGVGAPVFSGGKGGWEVFTGPTAGFLIGFLPAAWVTGKMVHSPWGQKILSVFLAMLAGHQIVLLFGLPWYGYQQGWEKIWPLWQSLTPGLLIKVALAGLITILVRALLKRISRTP